MAKFVDLGSLNKSSARVAVFAVRLCNGQTTDYEYTNKKTQKVTKAHKFEVHMVGQKPESYCIGYVKDSADAVGKARLKFLNGSVWLLSKVVFDTYAKAEYSGSPVPFRIDLLKSGMKHITPEDEQLKDLHETLPLCPVPPRTVAEVARITSAKSTDLLAIIKSCSKDIRTTKAGESVIDVELIDNTEHTQGKLATVKVSVFGAAKITGLKDKVGEAMVFFNLSVSCTGGSTSVSHYANELVQPAPQCTKTEALLAQKDRLSTATNTESLTVDWVAGSSRDVSGPQPLSCSAFLDFTCEAPNASMPQVVQLMWLHIEEPDPHATVTESSSGRIWYRASAKDASGSTVLGISQKMALVLANCATKEDFLRKHAAGSLNTPLLVHARISRTIRGEATLGGASQSFRSDTPWTGASQSSRGFSSQDGASQPVRYVNHNVEALEPVSWDTTSAPNASYGDILGLLNICPAHDDGVLFAFLADMSFDPHYGFRLSYDGIQGPQCAYAAVLIASGERSVTEAIGEGFKVTTNGIKDIANPGSVGATQPDGGAAPISYSALGYCSMDDIAGFRLDPPRGKNERVALCLFTKIDDEGLHLHKLEYIEPNQVENAIACMQKLRKLCKQIKTTSQEKRSRSMVFTSPAVKKARKLSAAPTDASLPEESVS